MPELEEDAPCDVAARVSSELELRVRFLMSGKTGWRVHAEQCGYPSSTPRGHAPAFPPCAPHRLVGLRRRLKPHRQLGHHRWEAHIHHLVLALLLAPHAFGRLSTTTGHLEKCHRPQAC